VISAGWHHDLVTRSSGASECFQIKAAHSGECAVRDAFTIFLFLFEHAGRYSPETPESILCLWNLVAYGPRRLLWQAIRARASQVQDGPDRRATRLQWPGCRVFQAGLADLNDADHFYNRGFLLPFRKSSGLGMNCVGASKPLTALIKHSHLPVVMLPPCVFPE